MKKLLLILLFCLITTSALGQFQQKQMLGQQIDGTFPASDFVGAWFFLEGSGNKVFDLSGNGNTGTVFNGSWVGGKFGPTILFNGTSTYIDVADLDSYLTGPFTMSFWWYNKANADTRIAYSSNVAGVKSKLATASSKFFIRVIDGGSSDNTVALPSQDAWHNIVLRRDSADKIDLIIDGSIINRLFSDAAQAGTSSIFRIIGVSAGAQYFNGYLDNFLVHNRALSASEIALLYREPFCMFKRDSIISWSIETVPPDWIGIDNTYIMAGGAGTGFCGEEAGWTLADALDGTDVWWHDVDETHWFIIDLGTTYSVTFVRGRSREGVGSGQPTDVNIYVSDNIEAWGAAVASSIFTWANTSTWVNIDTTDKDGRFVLVEIVDTSSHTDIFWGGWDPYDFFTIFDVYGSAGAAEAAAGQLIFINFF